MADNRVTLIVTGTRDDELPAASFVEQLQTLLAALDASDREAMGRVSVDWVVTALSRSSPAIVELEPKPKHGVPDDAPEMAVGRFFDLLESLQDVPDGHLQESVRRRTVKAFQEMGRPVEEGRLTATIHNGSRRAFISPALAPRAKAALAPVQYAKGYVEGRLQRINTHGDEMHMWIYPWVGPNRIKCRFSKDLIEDAGTALDHWVRAHGIIRYPAYSRHPTFIDVTGIEALPDLAEVPSLADLQGVAEDATEGLSSEDFTRRLRDAW